MEDPAFIYPCVCVVSVLAGLSFYYLYQRKKERERTQRLSAVAEELGLSFDPDGQAAAQAMDLLPLFNLGHSRRTFNLISGSTEEITLAVTDHRYVTGHGRYRQVHVQSGVCLQCPHLELPEFSLQPEKLVHQVRKAFGFRDINFDTHPDFSQRFLLRGPDEPAVREFFTVELLDALESGDHNRCIEARGDRLIYYHADKRCPSREIHGFLEDALAVYRHFRVASLTE